MGNTAIIVEIEIPRIKERVRWVGMDLCNNDIKIKNIRNELRGKYYCSSKKTLMKKHNVGVD